MRLNRHLYIKPEWVESNGMRLRGADLNDLFAKMRTYRERNKLPVGDPEKEFTEWFCRENPTYCHGIAKPIQERDNRRAPINTRILNWIERIASLRRALKFVSVEEGLKRAEICKGCPRNEHWEAKCAGCTSTVRSIRRNMAGKYVVKSEKDDALQGCGVLGEDLKLSVWMDRPLENNQDLPDHCWRKAK